VFNSRIGMAEMMTLATATPMVVRMINETAAECAATVGNDLGVCLPNLKWMRLVGRQAVNYIPESKLTEVVCQNLPPSSPCL